MDDFSLAFEKKYKMLCLQMKLKISELESERTNTPNAEAEKYVKNLSHEWKIAYSIELLKRCAGKRLDEIIKIKRKNVG